MKLIRFHFRTWIKWLWTPNQLPWPSPKNEIFRLDDDWIMCTSNVWKQQQIWSRFTKIVRCQTISLQRFSDYWKRQWRTNVRSFKTLLASSVLYSKGAFSFIFFDSRKLSYFRIQAEIPWNHSLKFFSGLSRRTRRHHLPSVEGFQKVSFSLQNSNGSHSLSLQFDPRSFT